MLDRRLYSDNWPQVFSRFVLAIAATGLACGCGNKQQTVSVQGAITYQAKPVTSGVINFMASNGRPLGGPINSEGKYSTNLPAGDYRVRIDAPAKLPADYKEGTPPPKLAPLVPEKYGNFNTSGLTAKIDEGKSSQDLDFKLP
jgi:hypothetical protein